MTGGILTATLLNRMTPAEILGCLGEPIELHPVQQFNGSDFLTRFIPHAGGVALIGRGLVAFDDKESALAAGATRRDELVKIFEEKHLLASLSAEGDTTK